MGSRILRRSLEGSGSVGWAAVGRGRLGLEIGLRKGGALVDRRGRAGLAREAREETSYGAVEGLGGVRDDASMSLAAALSREEGGWRAQPDDQTISIAISILLAGRKIRKEEGAQTRRGQGRREGVAHCASVIFFRRPRPGRAKPFRGAEARRSARVTCAHGPGRPTHADSRPQAGASSPSSRSGRRAAGRR